MATVSSCPESYNNMRTLWELCRINDIHARFALDNKMKVILYGLQSCASKYNCSFGLCFRNEDGEWVKGPNRTVEMVYKDNERWMSETNGNTNFLKH